MTAAEISARAAQQALFAKAPAGEYKIVTAKATNGPTVARVQIYGAIGDWWEGLDASTLATSIAAVEADEIEVHLNSPGGVAFDGIAIYNALRNHDASVRVHVDGLAASAASIVAMAGDEVIMETGAQLMVHNASGICLGNSDDMRQVAGVLDKVSSSLADIYAAHTGGKADDWRSAMTDETWYTAAEAVTAGLADRVGAGKVAADATAAFDLTIFAYAGRESAPEPHHMPPAEPAEPITPPKGPDMPSDTLISGLRERLGVKAELDENGLLAALDESLAEQPEDKIIPIPAGTVLIDKAQLDEMRASAEEGRQARTQQLADHRAQVVENAVTTGRIAPARRGDWLNALETDPGSEATLNALAAGLVPLTPAGFTGGVDESSDDDRTYEALYGADKEA